MNLELEVETWRRRRRRMRWKQSQRFPFLLISAALVVIISSSVPIIIPGAQAALIPPAKFDGFVYKNHRAAHDDSIIIEAFFDPVCPDSRDSWPPLKRALQHYGSRLSLIVHPFALPYHDNAFVACRALHIVNKLNASATYHMLELFFKHQEKFYNQPTHELSRASVVDHVVKLVAEAIGNSSVSAVASGFNDRQTDLTTRISFKYGCSRGVFGTPYFFVNGFSLPDAGSAIDYNGWRSILDPLVGVQSHKEEALHFFL